MKKLFFFSFDILLLAALGLCLYIKYEMRVKEVGKPIWECPICGESTEVVSTHYLKCTGDVIDREVFLNDTVLRNEIKSDLNLK